MKILNDFNIKCNNHDQNFSTLIDLLYSYGMFLIITGNTRGNSCLDIIFSQINNTPCHSFQT